MSNGVPPEKTYLRRGEKGSWASNHLEGEGRDVHEEEKGETKKMAKTVQRSASASVGEI